MLYNNAQFEDYASSRFVMLPVHTGTHAAFFVKATLERKPVGTTQAFH